ncbi:MAG: phospholipase [Gemmatimonadota bacterium]|nr:phospholipase [Gemmatimonadota bacterium]MDH5758800.1 phospholipase [Gemmatimonadota bacterium]
MSPAEPSREHHIEVPRTARYWTSGTDRPRPTELWFVLHGYRQLARRFLRRFQGIEAEGRWIVAPEGLSRFYVEHTPGRHGSASVVGATWMTREDRANEIRDYVRYLDLLAAHMVEEAASRPRVTVLGFSQGVHTASRWVTHGSVRPARLVLWGDYLPPDLDMEAAAARFGELDLEMVHGDADATLRPDLAAREEERLREWGIAPRRHRYAGGHDIDPELLASLAERAP